LPSPATEAAPVVDHGERLHAGRVAALFDLARPAHFATLANAAIVTVALWGPLTAHVLFGWFAAVLAVSVARMALQRRFANDAARPGDPHRWEMRFALGALAGGALWAFAVVVLFPSGEPLLQMAVMFVLGGMLIGAAGVYAPSPAAFFSFCTLPFLAAVAQLLLQPQGVYKLLALMALVFGAALVWVYRGLCRSIVDTLRAKFENQDLLARVARGESQLRDAIESFPEALAVWDGGDRLALCNEAYARAYGEGRRAEDLVGMSFDEIARQAYLAEAGTAQPPARRAARLAEQARLQREGRGIVREFQLRDGRWMRAKTTRTRSGGAVSVLADVTDLKRAQRDYEAVLAEENLILDVLPVGVAFLRDRVIERCNRRLEQMLDYAPGELAGRSTRVLFHSEAAWEAVGREVYARLGDGGIVERDGRVVRKNGSQLWCRALARVVRPEAPQEAAIFVIADADQRVAAERALRASEAMYRNLVETSNDLIWSVDSAGRWTYLNPASVRRIYRCGVAELLGRPFAERLAPEVRERDHAILRRLLGGEAVFNYETRHLRRDGTPVDLAFNAIPLRDAQGAVVGSTGTARDISEERAAAERLHESVEKLRLAVDVADLYYWEWEAASDRVHWGRNPDSLLGKQDGQGAKWRDYLEVIHPEDRDRYLASSEIAVRRGEALELEYRVIGREGGVRWISARGKPLYDGAGHVYRVIGVSQDVTERKRREEEVRFLAYHDTLTGLPNRRLLDDRLRQAVHLAQRRDTKVAVMVIDLDRFKEVNDALGHRAGDGVLREVAGRLAGCVRKADTLARHGGDEFVVVIPDLHVESECEVVADKVLSSLQAEFHSDGRAFSVGASIGISIYPTDAGDGEALLRNADVAMYRAKQLGRNHYLFYGR
jgi:diguanylate cyclase (GGDEF)-like protein/PAS domain S-box-containing protein